MTAALQHQGIAPAAVMTADPAAGAVGAEPSLLVQSGGRGVLEEGPVWIVWLRGTVRPLSNAVDSRI